MFRKSHASLARRSSSKSRNNQSKRRRSRRVQLERLENRHLLTTLIVNSFADDIISGDGLVTLREAIVAANADTTTDLGETGSGADTITFEPSVFDVPQTILLDLNDLPINDDLTIDGPTAGTLTIDANDNSQIFRIFEAETDANLNRLTLTGGNGIFGGAIANIGANLTIVDSTITGNQATSGGGGIDSYGGATLMLVNSTITGNTSPIGGGLNNEYYGGGSTATLINSTISGNTSTGQGGGIYNESTLTLINSTVVGNRGGAAGNGDVGGGLNNDGTATLNNTLVAGNVVGAVGSETDNDLGGNSNLTVTSSNNLIGDPLTAGGLTEGIAGNLLGDGSGGLLALDAILNPALADNGGPTQTHALRLGSRAIDAGAANAQTTDQRGALRTADTVGVNDGVGDQTDIGAFEGVTLVVNVFDPNPNVEVDDANINNATTTLREAVNFSNANPSFDVITFDTGGSPQTISLSGGSLDLINSVIINGPGANELTIDAQGNSRIFDVDSVDEVVFNGMTLTGGVSSVRGGAINAVSVGDITIANSKISGNSSEFNGGGVYAASSGSGTLKISRTEISGNTSDYGGGVNSNVPTTVTESTISGNSVTGRGGGIFGRFGGTVTVHGSTISGNSAAASYGGGIYSNGAVTVHGSTISGNSAGTSGGGILSPNNVTVHGSTISGNYAASTGGGIYGSRAVTVHGSTISGNSASVYGGGIRANYDVTIQGSTISGNSASAGGGVFSYEDVTIQDSTISGNSATFMGGGIFATYSVTVHGSTITQNSSSQAGGLIVSAAFGTPESLTIDSSIIAGNAGSSPDIMVPVDPSFNLQVTSSLIGDNTGTTLSEAQPPTADGNGNFIGTSANPIDPLLGPLGHNGGPFMTHSLLPGSPAINNGSSTELTDQRGAGRDDGGGVDMGAFELHRFFVVNNVGDASDLTPGDGVVDTGTPGQVTLRAAIQEANALANLDPNAPDMIFFDIPTSTITPATALPSITDAVIVAGSSQPGYTGSPLVAIDGSGTGAGVNGLRITGSGSTIRGFAIHGFASDAIELINGGDHVIEQNHLGLDLTGAVDGNFHGIRILNSNANTIDDNVISGNNRNGILASASVTTPANNVIINNKIGTDPTGLLERPNRNMGITLQSANNTVGSPGQGNVISGNNRWGIFLNVPGRGSNIIQSNLIGVDINGSAPLRNQVGIRVNNENNQIGGSGFDDGNVISANSVGVLIVQSAAFGNSLEGNLIGVDATGRVDVGNLVDGVRLVDAVGNTIGGLGAGEGNIISGNNQRGVHLLSNSSNNTIAGNKIGTDITGNAAVANSRDGVRIIDGSSDNLIEGNQISGNSRSAIATSGSTVSGTQIVDNLIGVDAAGTATLHNAGGLRITTPQTTIDGNVISDPTTGIAAWQAAVDLVITDNFIGTDASETVDLGMTNGISLAANAVAEITGNVIANNVKGIRITAGTGHRIQGNSIYDNSEIGIDLGNDGATANDFRDADTGVNNLQNSPEISSALLRNNQLFVDYLVDSAASVSNYNLQIEFFLSDGNGQGKRLIGSDLYLQSERLQTAFSHTECIQCGRGAW